MKCLWHFREYYPIFVLVIDLDLYQGYKSSIVNISFKLLLKYIIIIFFVLFTYDFCYLLLTAI